MAKAISKPKSSTTKKDEVGAGHLETVEQGEQGGSSEPVVVKTFIEEVVASLPNLPMTMEEKRVIGEDYPLTAMIYSEETPRVASPTDVLPESDGQLQGVSDPLQLFINLYQPGELVSKTRFRNILLTVLNDWKNCE